MCEVCRWCLSGVADGTVGKLLCSPVQLLPHARKLRTKGKCAVGWSNVDCWGLMWSKEDWFLLLLGSNEVLWCLIRLKGLMRFDEVCIRPVRLHESTSEYIKRHHMISDHISLNKSISDLIRFHEYSSDDITPYQTASVSTSPHETRSLIRFWYGLLWTHEVWWDLMWTSNQSMALNWQITWAFLFLAFKNWFVLITSYGKELLELFFCLVGT